jgi:hypothetical protein
MRFVRRVTEGGWAVWRRWRRPSLWSWLSWVIGAALAIGLVWSIFGWLGERAAGPTVAGIVEAKERAAAINAVRQTLLAAAGGLAATTGLAFTARTFYLSRRGQLTDRYTKAIGQLASDKLEERLGGIYALEHLMRESARDHQTVVDVLAAFVRQRSPVTSASEPQTATRIRPKPPLSPTGPSPRPSTDVQAALTVLGRRPSRCEPHGIDLAHTDLCGAYLEKGQLQGAILAWAWLPEAELRMVQLQDADLYGAQLQGANLTEAQLQGARLEEAQLQGTHLSRARLQRVNFARANLDRAELFGAQLQGAINLTSHQLRQAHCGETTSLDPALRKDLAP